jgi:L-ascorbate metabolism protein UlaG (beta-lactamase superfamily)
MEITWLGQSCFKIKSHDLVLVTDPFSIEIGLKLPKTEANILTVSHGHFDHNNISGIFGNPFIIDGPGEYEVRGVNISGILTYHDSSGGAEQGQNTIYLIEMEELRICHLGDLGHSLSDRELEKIDGVDILMIPVGGVYTIGTEKAQEVISQINPKIIIPMHYKIEGLKPNLESLDKFCKEMGVCKETQDKLVIKKSTLSEEEEEQVFILKKK